MVSLHSKMQLSSMEGNRFVQSAEVINTTKMDILIQIINDSNVMNVLIDTHFYQTQFLTQRSSHYSNFLNTLV